MKFLLAVLFLLTGLHAAEIRRGEIGGAKYMIAAPAQWQGKLLLLAHGYRAEDQELSADFDATDRFAAPLLEQGWCIASTSYRRNGWIVEDAILDLKALRDHVAKESGEVKRCLIVGNSMGGLIGTLVAEGAMEGVDGVVAIGAYLGDRETGSYYQSLKWQPRVPVIFLTNETELDHPRHYREKAGAERTALWEVKRPGHCNVSDPERHAAVLALDAWIDGKAPEKDKDGTVGTPARKSTAAKVDGGLAGKITFASASWGNLSSDLVAADLGTLGLEVGDKARVQAKGGELEVTVCRYRTDVPSGEGALYVTPEGWLAIVIHGGNAAEALGVKLGDAVTVRAKPAK
jgi:pimeloyl-ACP methyl ester carboxylesterase